MRFLVPSILLATVASGVGGAGAANAAARGCEVPNERTGEQLARADRACAALTGKRGYDAAAHARIMWLRTGDPAAFERVRQLAQAGDAAAPHAQVAFGEMLLVLEEALETRNFGGRYVAEGSPLEQALKAVQTDRRNRTSGLDTLRRAVTAGDAGALVPLAMELAWPGSSERKHDAFEASVLLERARNAGDVRASAILATLYRDGRGVPQDVGRAVVLLREGANRGDPMAQMLLGVLYGDGRAGLDLAQSHLWIDRAAAGGNAIARRMVAERRIGAGKPETAVRLLELAVEQGDAIAARLLSGLLARGSGVAADPERARTMLDMASNGGDCEAAIAVAGREERELYVSLRISSAANCISTVSRTYGRQYRLIYFAGGTLTNAQTDRYAKQLYEVVDRRLKTPFFRVMAGEMKIKSADRQVALAGYENLVAAAALKDQGYEGKALAILAYPSANLHPDVRAKIDTAHWRKRIAAIDTPDTLVEAAQVMVENSAAGQAIGPALALLDRAAAKDPLKARQAELKLLIKLKLYDAALDRLARYADDKALREKQESLFGSFKAEADSLCGWRSAFVQFARMSDDPDYDGACDGRGAFLNASPPQLEKLAKLGFAGAMAQLGFLHLAGERVERDDVKAFAYFSQAAEQNHRIGQAMAAMMHETGRGTPVDLKRAVELYRAASKGNIVFSDVRLAAMYAEGRGVAADPARAVELWRDAANLGDPTAQHRLGDAYALGHGVVADLDEAARWYRLPAVLGDRVAAAKIAHIEARLAGSLRTPEPARWIKLAEGGAENTEVAMALAGVFAFGPVTGDDAGTAVRWLRRASEGGSAEARRWLESCGADTACLRRQPGFGAVFAGIAGGRPPAATARPAAVPIATMIEDLEAQLKVSLDRGDLWRSREALKQIEQTHRLAGDADGQVEARMRRLMVIDGGLRQQFGSLNNYFALLSSSCHWGQASRAAFRAGKPDAALTMAKVAVNRLQEARGYLKDLDGDVRECFIQVHQDRYRWLADLFIKMKRYPEAASVLSMLKDFEHLNHTRDHALRGQADDQLALSDSEKALVSKVAEGSEALSGAFGGEARTPATAADARLAFGEKTRAIRVALAASVSREADPEAARERLGRVSEVSIPLMRTVAKLRKGTVAVHAVVLPNELHWLITTADRQQAVSIPIDEQDLSRKVVEFVSEIRDVSSSVGTSAHGLYLKVFKPLDEALAALGADNVLLSLDGALRYVPFAALRDDRDWLIKRYTFATFRKEADLVRGGTAEGELKIAGFGATRGGSGLSPLPYVAHEVASIVRSPVSPKGLVPGQPWLDDKFDETALSAAMDDPQFRVLHIASHVALSAESGDNSFLLLGDGSPLKLSRFRDAGYFFRYADLVVLSACETGVARAAGGKEAGNGSDFDSSMATLVQDAGAPSVMASLWSVNDRATSLLMTSFYERYAKGGMTKAAALREAQLAFIAGRATDVGSADRGDGRKPPAQSVGGSAHPFYWAPFVMVGSAL